MKIAGIILLVLQAMAILGGDFGKILTQAIIGGAAGFSQLLGFLFPGIIGAVLLICHSRKSKAKAVKEAFDNDPDHWICCNCKSKNGGSQKNCPKCGTAKEWEPLRDGQAVQQAKAEVKAEAQAAAYTPPVDPEATVPSRDVRKAGPESVLIYISGGSMDGSCFRCRKGAPVLMGRDPARCNLIMNGYAAISGLHCRLELDGSGVSVTDLGSSNGTWVEGTRLMPNRPAAVPDGGEISLAGQACILRVKYE